MDPYKSGKTTMNKHHSMNHSMDEMNGIMSDMNQHMHANHSMMHGTNHSLLSEMMGMNHTTDMSDHGLHGHHGHMHDMNSSLHDGIDHSIHHGVHHGHDDVLHGNHSMYFSFGFPKVIVLQGWTVTSNKELIVSLLGLCIIAIFLESISRLTKRASSKTLCYMAKKNLKGFRKLLDGSDAQGCNYKTIPTKDKDNQTLQTESESNESRGPRGNIQMLDVTPGGVKRTLSAEVPEKVKQDGVESIMVETDIPLTLPQCLQYRLLLTILHVIQALLGYFLMLALMTYNWWIFIVILAGSVVGFLLFGQGTYFHALEMMASSTLPPNFVSRTTLKKLETNETALRHDSVSQLAERPEASPLVNQNTIDDGELEVWKRQSACGLEDPSSGLQKMTIRIDFQGASIPQSEFFKRLEKSQETVL